MNNEKRKELLTVSTSIMAALVSVSNNNPGSEKKHAECSVARAKALIEAVDNA